MDRGGGDGWSEAVEDVVERGGVEVATSSLSSPISKRTPPRPTTSASPISNPPMDSPSRPTSSAPGLGSVRRSWTPEFGFRFLLILIKSCSSCSFILNRWDCATVKEKEPSKEEIRVSSPSNNQEDEDGSRLGSHCRPGAPDKALLSQMARRSCLNSDQPDIVTALEPNSGFENKMDARGHHFEDESIGTGD
nr:uncharacterized protein LOC105038320 isoform X2 [Elaeis guineensis]